MIRRNPSAVRAPAWEIWFTAIRSRSGAFAKAWRKRQKENSAASPRSRNTRTKKPPREIAADHPSARHGRVMKVRLNYTHRAQHHLTEPFTTGPPQASAVPLYAPRF